MSVDDEGRLPPAHPNFAAHFTSRFYDADDFENDELAPFSTDDGADTVTEWAGRIKELRRSPSLQRMLGADADERMADLRREDDADGDGRVVSLGFTLLRYAGQIDPKGRAWLLEALRREDRRHPDGDYATMIKDLTRFKPPTEPTPRAATTDPAEPWLLILCGGGDRGLDRWCRRVEHAVAADPEWQDWWSAADLDRLTVYPHLGSRRNYVEFTSPSARELDIVGSSAQLGKVVRRWQGRTVRADDPPQPPILSVPGFVGLWEALILQLLEKTADHLGLAPLPKALPD